MSKLRIVKGNTFETVIQVKAYTYRGEEIPDFDLRKCTDVIANSIVNGKSKPIKLFEIIDEQHMVLAWPAKYQEVGSYQLEVKGKLNGVDWRFYDKKPIFDIVLTNFEANIPQWSIIRDNFYTVDKQSIYMLDGIGAITNNDFATVATTGSYNDLIDKPELFDGDYTNLTNKPDLSTYQLKDGDKVLSDNNYTNEDKATVESVSTDYYTKSQIDTDFQSKLVSGTNIKTINGQSILGNGNINLLTFVATNTLPPADANTVDKIYLVPSNYPDEAANNIKEEWVTIQVATENITYDGVDYPITNRGNFISFLENGGTTSEAGPGIVGVVLLTSYDSTTANIHFGYISPLGWVGKQIGADDYGWDNFSPKLGDSYTNVNDHKTYVCTPNGWVDKDILPISYDWELIGSTQINLKNYYTKTEIDTVLDGATLAIDESDRLIITQGANRFFAQLIELSKPERPTISVTTASVVTGNATFTATCTTTGATIKYSLDNGSTWSNGPTVTVPSGFSNSSNNTTKTQSVKLKAIKNGEESDVASITVTINPKVATGSISIVRNGNNNDWSTQATITLTSSASAGATSSYSQDGGSTWTTFSSTVTLTTSSSQSANTYQVKATKSGYVNSDVVKSAAFTLNKKKFYYGMGNATLANEAAIRGLAGGGSEEKSTMAGTYSITTASTGKYIWFCGTGTLTSVTSGGFGVPMQAVAVVDGYNCYRSTSAVREAGTNTFIVA